MAAGQLARLKVVLAQLLVLSKAGGGLAFLRPEAPAAGPEEAPRSGAPGTFARQATDLYGDPLPAGAVARLGTVRLRHSGAVWTLAISPDGTQVVSGRNDGTARLWDTTTGKELRGFTGKGGYVKSVAFTPDGKALITGGTDSLHVWDIATGSEIPLPRGRAGARAGQLLKKLAALSGARLRVERAVEALEPAASAEARKLLTDLAAGATDPRGAGGPAAAGSLSAAGRGRGGKFATCRSEQVTNLLPHCRTSPPAVTGK